MTIAHLDPCAAINVAHLASAIEVVYQHIGTVQHNMGTYVNKAGGNGVEVGIDGSEIVGNVTVMSSILSVHIAGIAAAIEDADAARSKRDGRHHCHGLLVVAAKEGTHIIYACAVPHISAFDCADIVANPRFDSVSPYLAAANAVNRHVGLSHAGFIAAGKDSVALTSSDDHVRRIAHHLVAAAKYMGYAEIPAQHFAIIIVVVSFGFFYVIQPLHRCAVDLHMVLAGSLRAAKVVAAEEGIYSATIDGDGGAVGIVGGIGDKGILGTAENRVNLHNVVGYRDGSLDNGGEIQGLRNCPTVGPHSLADSVVPIHDVDSTADSHRLRGVAIRSSLERDAVIDIVAVATAINIVHPHLGRSSTVVISDSIRVAGIHA